MTTGGFTRRALPAFDRAFFESGATLSRIGNGELGGKALGLVLLQELVRERLDGSRFSDVVVDVPRMAVLTTDVFDTLMESNGLVVEELAELPDDRISHVLQHADLPVATLGDLRGLVESVHLPLAVRSSSLLEDAMFRPFAGVYGTKMTPNNQPEADDRFSRLVQAIKYVYATTFHAAARSYLRAAGRRLDEEKMAVVIQEVVGHALGDRFYPEVSGVARTYNFYPVAPARPEQGVIHLALGLGKTIVDGGISWAYCPAYPRRPPPFHSPRGLLKRTQTSFWAVNTGRPPEFDPVRETEYLVQADLADAERDGVLDLVASTYDAASERLDPGVGAPGPRALTFAPLLDLQTYRLNDALIAVMDACAEALGTSVEVEFAACLPRPGTSGPARLALLQVRPMVVSEHDVDLDEGDLAGPGLLLGSRTAIGNGVHRHVRDVVYLKPRAFDRTRTRQIAQEVATINERLVEEGRPYLLIGFGRWGSSIPTLGVPIDWARISGALVIVETTLPDMNVEPSQGSHFFQNLSSFRVSYLTVHEHDRPGVDWGWLDERPAVSDTPFVRHVRVEHPLTVKVDGRHGRAAVWHHD